MKQTILVRARRLCIAISLTFGFAASFSSQLVSAMNKTISKSNADDDANLVDRATRIDQPRSAKPHLDVVAEQPMSQSKTVATTNLAISDNAGPAASMTEAYFEPGPVVGESIPEITLRDQWGDDISVQEMLLDGPVALVFHRSANWCPYCKRHLLKMQRELDSFKSAGLQIVAISYDKVSDLKVFAVSKGISYPMLSDEGSELIREMGLESERGISHPGTFIVGTDGVIQSKLFMQGYKRRHSNADVIAAFESSELLAV